MKSYVHLLGRLVCLQASPYYLLHSAGLVPAITYVSYNGDTARPRDTRPQGARTLEIHGF